MKRRILGQQAARRVLTPLLVLFTAGAVIAWAVFAPARHVVGPLAVERIYELCGHVVSTGEVIRELPDEKSFADVYPGAVRYSVEPRKVVKLYFEDLCPDCSARRSLKEVSGRVGVFQGPPHAKGKLLFVTDIEVNDLPAEWQQKVRDGFGFNNEDELNHALDSLEEFTG